MLWWCWGQEGLAFSDSDCVAALCLLLSGAVALLNASQTLEKDLPCCCRSHSRSSSSSRSRSRSSSREQSRSRGSKSRWMRYQPVPAQTQGTGCSCSAPPWGCAAQTNINCFLSWKSDLLGLCAGCCSTAEFTEEQRFCARGSVWPKPDERTPPSCSGGRRIWVHGSLLQAFGCFSCFHWGCLSWRSIRMPLSFWFCVQWEFCIFHGTGQPLLYKPGGSEKHVGRKWWERLRAVRVIGVEHHWAGQGTGTKAHLRCPCTGIPSAEHSLCDGMKGCPFSMHAENPKIPSEEAWVGKSDHKWCHHPLGTGMCCGLSHEGQHSMESMLLGRGKLSLYPTRGALCSKRCFLILWLYSERFFAVFWLRKVSPSSQV